MTTLNAAQIATCTTSIKNAVAKIRATNRVITDADAKDFAQTAWVKILMGYNGDESTLAGFAYRCTFNAATDWLRGRKGCRLDQRFVSTDATVGEDASDTIGSIMPSAGPTPLQALVAKRREEAVTVALGNLSAIEVETLLADSDAPASGADRIRKMRAIDKLQETVIAA